MNRPPRPNRAEELAEQNFLEKVIAGQDLLQRVTRLETHREYAATREEVAAAAKKVDDRLSDLGKKVDDRLSDLAKAVATISVSMATKTWILGSVVAFLVSLAAAALHAYIRAKLG